jgi:hypothetical protein
MGVKVQSSNGKQFVNDPLQVCEYLAQVYGTGQPRA